MQRTDIGLLLEIITLVIVILIAAKVL